MEGKQGRDRIQTHQKPPAKPTVQSRKGKYLPHLLQKGKY